MGTATTTEWRSDAQTKEELLLCGDNQPSVLCHSVRKARNRENNYKRSLLVARLESTREGVTLSGPPQPLLKLLTNFLQIAAAMNKKLRKD